MLETGFLLLEAGVSDGYNFRRGLGTLDSTAQGTTHGPLISSS